jgi:hypothetical protein
LVGSTAEALYPEEYNRSDNRPGVPSGIRTRVSRLRIWLPGPSSKDGDMANANNQRGDRPGIEPGHALLSERAPHQRSSSKYRRNREAVRENRTPVPSLARSDSTTELPPRTYGASSGNRTRIDGLEDRGPTLGRCPLELIPIYFTFFFELLARIALAISCIPGRRPASWA